MRQLSSMLMFAVALVLAANSSLAQSRFQVLGIFDESTMERDFGTMTGTTKSIWVGVLPGGPFDDGHTGFQFSISGLEAFATYSAQFPSPPLIALGSVAAPTDTINGSGGIALAWNVCQTPGIAFMEIVLYSPTPPQDHTLHIRRVFESGDPSVTSYPFGFQCDAPCNCEIPLACGSYVLNPEVGTETASWARIKQLYRSP